MSLSSNALNVTLNKKSQWFHFNAYIVTKYFHSSLCHAMLFCNQNMVVLLIHLALTKYYCCSNETMCWHFDKKAQEQIFEDNPVWFEISGMGVMGRFTRPLPLPAPLELPAPYPILPLPDWGLFTAEFIFQRILVKYYWYFFQNPLH